VKKEECKEGVVQGMARKGTLFIGVKNVIYFD
jgi:hypothetical protein